jgi:methionine synthase I (cobalamin-dependent)
VTASGRKQVLEKQLQEGLLIGDGGMGTWLHAHGARPGQSLELLNVDHPEIVVQAHEAFLDAGCDLLQTNTFQGNPVSLAKHGLAERCADLNRAGTVLARKVAGKRVVVAASVGPTGEILAPYGELSADRARAAFEEQTRVLAASGVDLFILETFFALEEICLALDAALATGLPVVAGMAFDPGGHTTFGVTPEQAAEQLSSAGAAVVGANCGTVSPAEMVEVMERFRRSTSLPLFAQPNAGRPQQTTTGVVYPETPESMADAAVRFRDLGATVIGGCDGATPEHVRAIADRLRRGRGAKERQSR